MTPENFPACHGEEHDTEDWSIVREDELIVAPRHRLDPVGSGTFLT